MSGYSAHSAIGRVVAGEVDTIFAPRTPRPNKYGVVLLHGQSNPRGFIDTAQLSASRLAAALASSGIPCIAAEMHGNSWANDQAMTDIDSARAVLQAAYPAMRTDKICLVAASMGGSLGARYSQLYPASVAAFVGIIPAYDPKAIRAEFKAGWWGTILTDKLLRRE